jgi:hypothetical protein
MTILVLNKQNPTCPDLMPGSVIHLFKKSLNFFVKIYNHDCDACQKSSRVQNNEKVLPVRGTEVFIRRTVPFF